MKRTELLASVLAGIATLAGAGQTGTPQAPSTQQAAVQQQRADTPTPPAAPASNAVVQNLRAGATIVPLYIPGRERPRRWAWVGRKVNGKFGYYCRPVGSRV